MSMKRVALNLQRFVMVGLAIGLLIASFVALTLANRPSVATTSTLISTNTESIIYNLSSSMVTTCGSGPNAHCIQSGVPILVQSVTSYIYSGGTLTIATTNNVYETVTVSNTVTVTQTVTKAP